MKLLSILYGPQELGQTFLRYLPAVVNTSKKIGVKKILNVIHAEFERKIKKVKVTAHPFILHIELTNVCNLKCPYCVTGNESKVLKQGFISFDGFKKIVDEMKDYLILVRLDGLGESFLNKDFFRMLEYASKNNIITSVSTNFVTIAKEDTEKLIDAGLDYLIIGLDGATEEVYQRVRPGGKLEKVVENIKYLVNKKIERKSKTPFVETQYITFEENHHEVEQARELSIALGADRHLIKDLREYTTNVAEVKKAHKTKSCYWLWYVVNISWQGDLKACCFGLADEFSFGNILNNNVMDEWNNQSMQDIRKLFTKPDPVINEELKGCICLDSYKLIG